MRQPTGEAPMVGKVAPPYTVEEFTEWVRPYWSAMAGLAFRLSGVDGEDAAQEALASAWRKRDQYDPERGTPRVWLLAIVADQCRKSWRRQHQIPVDDLELAVARGGDPAGGSRPTADQLVDLHLDLDLALGCLTERQRLAVELHYFVGLTIPHVADVMGCASGTVKSTLSDARNRLRTALGKDYR